jgi:large subunit ribosomal protein L29|tara:strand:- start:618 stop:818 length:201 start_codon:yes stop_codon:yes gene_type:complete
MMKQKEVNTMTLDELQDKLAQLQKSYKEARFTHALSNLENPLQLRSQRRVIARLQTELNRRKTQEA